MLVSLPLGAAGSVHAGALPADRCLDYREGGVVRYTCSVPATVAFCVFSYTMSPQAAEAEAGLARDLLCRPSEFMNHPCRLRGPGTCGHAKAQARRLGIASMDAVWRVCEGMHDVPRYEGRGEFGCAAAARGADAPDRTGPSTGAPLDVRADTGFSKDDVLEAQELLAASGYDPGPADGLWGPRTGRAVQSFLSGAGLALADLLTVQARRVLRGAASSGRGDVAGEPPRSAGAGSTEKACELGGDGARREASGAPACTASAIDERSRTPDRTAPSTRVAVRGADGAGVSAGDVLQAQEALSRLGYDPGPADGHWGPMTGKAVQSFLGDAGLSLADVLAMHTLAAVREAASSGRAGDTPEPTQEPRDARSTASRGPGAVHEASSARRAPEPRCADMRRPSACWMEFENVAGCHMWLEKVGPEVTVLSAAWHGACSEGRASGPGTRQVKVRFLIDGESLEGEGLESGTFVAGKARGRWVSLDNGGGMRTVTDYVDGEVQRIEVRNTATGSCIVSNFDRGTFLNSHAC